MLGFAPAPAGCNAKRSFALECRRLDSSMTTKGHAAMLETWCNGTCTDLCVSSKREYNAQRPKKKEAVRCLSCLSEARGTARTRRYLGPLKLLSFCSHGHQATPAGEYADSEHGTSRNPLFWLLLTECCCFFVALAAGCKAHKRRTRRKVSRCSPRWRFATRHVVHRIGYRCRSYKLGAP